MDHDLLRFVFSYSVFRLLSQYQRPLYLMEYQQTEKEEFWNTLTHAFGLVLALFGVWVLWSSIDLHNDKLFSWSFTILCFTRIAIHRLYLISLYKKNPLKA